MSFTLSPSQSDSLVMTISNSGASDLTFQLGSVPYNANNIAAPGRIPASALSAKERLAHDRRNIGGGPNADDELNPAPTGPAILPEVLDAEDIFGSTANPFAGTLRDRGNVFLVNDATTLLESRLYLNVPTDVEFYHFVYEGAALTGSYSKINEVYIPNSGSGEGFYSSGAINVPLEAGKYYYIGISWGNSSVTYYRGNETVPLPVSFGTLQTGIPSTVAGFPPADPINSTWSGFSPYYGALVTGEGISWLSPNPAMGSVPPGGSMDVQVRVNSEGLLGGEYLARIAITSNDPVTPDTSMPVRLFVQGEAIVSAAPNPLIFPDDVLVGGSDEATLTVNNEGNGVLTVSNIASGDPQFSVNPASFNIPAFESVDVTVTFAPTAAGTISGSLTIVSNASNNPYSLGVQGVAVNAPQAVVTPTEITENVAVGDTLDVPVQIENAAGAGAANLDWSASLVEGTASLRITPFIGPLSDQTDAASPSKADGKAISLVLENPWDLQVNINLETVTGALGNAGSEFDGTYYYTTRWATNLIHKIDMSGVVVEEFSIGGVTGLRDLAFDGTFMYGGAAANTIFQMDFASKTLIGTIPSPVAVRHIAYDAGADGFWVGTWDTPPTLISRSGTVIATLTSGLLSQYGSAYDDYSEGGPYLWIFNQGSGAGLPQFIHQFNLNTGTATGFTHDVLAELGPNASAIAGGLWIGEGIVAGKASIGGTLQGTPDVFFVYELANAGPVWMSFDPSTPNSGSVAPGDLGGFMLQLHPPAAGIYNGSIVINSNDPANPLISIPVELGTVGIGEEELLPATFAISRNYPNPFNPTTMIDYQLPQSADVKLEIYNVLGQKVRTLVNAKMAAGRYQATWDARNDAGTPVGSGVYIYRFWAGDYKSVQKMVLMK